MNYYEAMRREIEAQKKADHLEARANTVSSAISSDDPDAIDKLDEEIARLEALQERMKAVNKAVRKAVKNRVLGVTDGNNTYSAKAFEQFMIELREIPGCEEINATGATAYLKPDELGRRGYPDYSTTNNGANIRRLKLRRAQLEKAAEAPQFVEYRIGDVTVCENSPENRLQIFFEGRPDADVRAKLKSHGFRWSPTVGAWQRHLNNGARYAAECVLGRLPE